MPESERVGQSHALADSRPGLRLVWWRPDKGFFTAMSSVEQHVVLLLVLKHEVPT